MSRLSLLLILPLGVLSGCMTSDVLLPHTVDISVPESDVSETQRLDVGVVVFDPGVPEGEISKDILEELIARGAYVNIRRAESVYMATELRDALQESGYWGTVWVTPQPSLAADLTVAAKILSSDGHIARLEVTATDAAGDLWLEKTYEFEAPAAVYDRRRYPNRDPYQDLFNSIANDLAALRSRLPPARAERIRTVASVRYAESLIPARFEGYIAEDKGHFELVRLPAAEDPMFEGSQHIRQRERLLLEALNSHYDRFASGMSTSYSSWRQSAREEAASARDLKRSARWNKALGIAATVASIASFMRGGGGSGMDQQGFSNRFLRESLMLMGANMLQKSAVHTQGMMLHTAALEELSESFDDEAHPLVVEIAGVQRRLTGTAEMQFVEWRELLQQMFKSEAGGAFAPIEVSLEPELTEIVLDTKALEAY